MNEKDAGLGRTTFTVDSFTDLWNARHMDVAAFRAVDRLALFTSCAKRLLLSCTESVWMVDMVRWMSRLSVTEKDWEQSGDCDNNLVDFFGISSEM